ncbi:hypothetical protein, partial [Vibrio sp. 10N.261.51.C6]|uniref:hypothetical protein n=1 Tax=Vibrio sp. 10N.261.51.C6 TaxID=3229676 RepID=UPI00354C4146
DSRFEIRVNNLRVGLMGQPFFIEWNVSSHPEAQRTRISEWNVTALFFRHKKPLTNQRFFKH